MTTTPPADRQGFSVPRAFTFTLATVAIVVTSFGGARAATVSMTLDVTALQPFAAVPLASCDVVVASGSDAVVVLDAGVQTGCIDSYEVTSDPQFGRFLSCINDICGTDATYWRMGLDGAVTPYGLDGYEASGGDALEFSYTVWAGCLADPSLC